MKPIPPVNLWAEMERIHAQSNLQISKAPTGFTVEEYANKFDLSLPGAASRLAKMVREGRLVCEWGKAKGLRCKFFRPAPPAK